MGFALAITWGDPNDGNKLHSSAIQLCKATVEQIRKNEFGVVGKMYQWYKPLKAYYRIAKFNGNKIRSKVGKSWSIAASLMS